MNKDPKVFLAHIMESIGMVEEYSEGKTYSFFSDHRHHPLLLHHPLSFCGSSWIKNLSTTEYLWYAATILNLDQVSLWSTSG
jgi:uncharacterized protein with HEPN domain